MAFPSSKPFCMEKPCSLRPGARSPKWSPAFRHASTRTTSSYGIPCSRNGFPTRPHALPTKRPSEPSFARYRGARPHNSSLTPPWQGPRHPVNPLKFHRSISGSFDHLRRENRKWRPDTREPSTPAKNHNARIGRPLCCLPCRARRSTRWRGFSLRRAIFDCRIRFRISTNAPGKRRRARFPMR